MATESKINMLFRALLDRSESLTARQIAARYRISNPYDLIYRLRNEGIKIERLKTTNSRGKIVYRYSWGGV